MFQVNHNRGCFFHIPQYSIVLVLYLLAKQTELIDYWHLEQEDWMTLTDDTSSNVYERQMLSAK